MKCEELLREEVNRLTHYQTSLALHYLIGRYSIKEEKERELFETTLEEAIKFVTGKY